MPQKRVELDLRLVMRVVEGWWVASLCRHETLDGATEIARIRIAIVMRDAQAKAAFMATVQNAVETFIISQHDFNEISFEWEQRPLRIRGHG